MKVYGLFGKSGTGKSHKSVEVVSKYQIDAMIDDGILIINKIRVAGISAKNERYMHAATKRAIFYSEEHRLDVMHYLQKSHIDKLLVIGTSKKMVRRIVERLDLLREIEWISIESFQSEEELKLASERRGKGYHVIPIQPVKVENTYSGWFRKLMVRFGKRNEAVTLIKPLYVSNDKITIDPRCIHDLVYISARKHPQLKIHMLKVDAYTVTVMVSLTEGETFHRLLEWKNDLSSALNDALGIPYKIHMEWRSIIRTKPLL